MKRLVHLILYLVMCVSCFIGGATLCPPPPRIIENASVAFIPLPAPLAPQVDVFCMDATLERFSAAWRVEVGRRFPDAIVLLCHGGELSNGEWLVKAPAFDLPLMTAEHLVEHFQVKFPGRPVVLLACNPGHLHLHVPGVWHARNSVWCVPDRAIGGSDAACHLEMDGKMTASFGSGTRWDAAPDVTGNVFEFVED